MRDVDEDFARQGKCRMAAFSYLPKRMVDGLMTAFAIGVVIWWMSGYGG